METFEKKQHSTKKRWKRISIIACILLFFIIFRYVFFPSGTFCDKHYKDINMYMDGSYVEIGWGFHNYGEVASQWLPKFEELPSGATVLSFFFMHGSFFYRTYGAFVLITQYQDEATYQKLREELLTVEDESDLTTDMQDSIAFARKFVKKHPNSHITFIGHSKGGAEAAANAVATNRDAIIFNPATVNLSAYGLDASAYSADMTAYIVNGEVLNRTFGTISSPIDKEERLGFSVPSVSPVVEVGKLVFSFVKHSMTTVIKLLEEKQGVEK